MRENADQRLLPTQEQRCRVRLENDCRALEAAASRRMRVVVTRFGDRVQEIDLLFPQVTVGLFNKASGDVEVRRADVLAHIRPNAGHGFPYPLGAPEVRIYVPDIRTDLYIPWSGGLFWFDELILRQETPPALRAMVEAFSSTPRPRMGIPCLWRTWHPDYDLLFVANQTHRLFTDPGEYSPTDCMNGEAALYWASHKDRLPLEPPIPELAAAPGKDSAGSGGAGFTLVEVRLGMDGSSGTLQARAERALIEALPRQLAGRFPRVEVLPQDGAMVLFREPGTDEADPVAILRRNGQAPGARLFAPLVVDPETGIAAKRYIIPYRVWAAPGALGAYLDGDEKEQARPVGHGALRLAKGIPEGVRTHRYGRSERFSLLLGEVVPVLAVRIFPGGFVESGLAKTPERCAGMAWVLLARSGAAGKPYPFHILGEESFFQVERALAVPAGMGEARGMRMLETELLKGAEEDRKVLMAMLATTAPWEPFFQRQRRECHDRASKGTRG